MNKLERLEALEAEIKKLKQEFSEPEFEAGWYWAGGKAKAEQTYLAYYKDTTSNEAYGFGWAGLWSDRLHTTFDEYKIPATESEVFEALKKEAIKRGFKEGVKGTYPDGFKSSGADTICKDGWFYRNGTLFAAKEDCGGLPVFYNGKWAEIIDEPFKVCGYEVKRDGNYYKIGCKIINKEYLQNIYYLMAENDFNTVSFDDKGVDFKTLKKILEL